MKEMYDLKKPIKFSKHSLERMEEKRKYMRPALKKQYKNNQIKYLKRMISPLNIASVKGK
jgi:hypothetical protein